MSPEGTVAAAAPPPSMNRMAVRSGVAMGAAQLVKTGLQFLTIVLLARLLQPADFGLVAAVAPLTSFVLLFQDLGLQQMLVQRREVTGPIFSFVVWVTLAIGLACAGLMLLASPLVAWFYGDPRLQPLAATAALVVLGGSLCAGPTGMLNRALRFRTMAVITTAAAAAGLTVALLVAWAGGRYWALILAPAASTLVTLAGAWYACGQRPGPPRLRPPETGLLSFGANLTGFTFLNYFARNLDNILIGRVLGSVALGYYDQAYKLLLFPLVTINNPLGQVVVPLLSRIETDKRRLRTAYLRVVTQLVLVTVPGVAAMTVTAPDVIALLFGPRWAPVAEMFAWLGVAGLLQPVNNSTGWLFISQARTHAMLRWGAFGSTVAVLSFVVGLHWGAVGVAAAYAMSEYLRTPFLYVVIGRVGPVTPADLLRVQLPPLAAAAGTFAVVHWGATGLFHLTGLPRIAVALAVSYTLTLALVALRAEGRTAIRDGLALAARRK